MNRHLEQIVFAFLKTHYDPAQPLLLALSGGPDSMALFYILQKFKEKSTLQFAVAHVDHGWREESRDEASQLKALSESFGIPFHLKTISPQQLQGNLEAACRQERLQFFAALSKEHGYQAVLLAHHADDQAETVLKRVLEGADMPFLTGLQQENWIDGARLWRPMLPVAKAEILKWLEQHDIEAFIDRTNLDSRFLRGRFRTHIIPFLSTAFGKEVTTSLCHVGKEAQELKTYLSDSFGHYLEQVVAGPFGSFLDLSNNGPSHPFELRYILRELCRRNNFILPRAAVDTACELLIEGKGNRLIEVGEHRICIDRRHLFIVHQSMLQELPPAMDLEEGTFQYGIWNVLVERVNESRKPIGGLREVWKGHLSISLPEGKYRIGPANLQSPYPGDHATISKWWTNEKVPAFLRHLVPVIWENNTIRHEFLSGRLREKGPVAESSLQITLNLLK